jgi:hypothetical protein
MLSHSFRFNVFQGPEADFVFPVIADFDPLHPRVFRIVGVRIDRALFIGSVYFCLYRVNRSKALHLEFPLDVAAPVSSWAVPDHVVCSCVLPYRGGVFLPLVQGDSFLFSYDDGLEFRLCAPAATFGQVSYQSFEFTIFFRSDG